MTLIPRIPSKDHYHIPSKSWVSVLAKKDGNVFMAGDDNIIKKVPRTEIRTYTEYISQFTRRELVTKN